MLNRKPTKKNYFRLFENIWKYGKPVVNLQNKKNIKGKSGEHFLNQENFYQHLIFFLC